MKTIEFGAFCELYGKTLRNRVIEYMLEMGSLDFAVSDVLKEVSISKPKMYDIIREMEEQGLVKKTRVVAGTQLYALNKDKNEVKLLQRAFKECLKMVAEKHYKPAVRKTISITS